MKRYGILIHAQLRVSPLPSPPKKCDLDTLFENLDDVFQNIDFNNIFMDLAAEPVPPPALTADVSVPPPSLIADVM